jgi:hypothetical protein
MIFRILFAGLNMLLISASLSGAGENKDGFDIGFSVGGGFTAVNFEKASGYSDDYLEDWGQGHFKATLYGLAKLAPKFKAGIEVGYNDLYWWYYRIPYGPSPVYRSAEWSTLSLLGIFHKDVGRLFFIQAGAGFHFFDGDPAFALSAAIGIQPRFKNIMFPVSFRVDPIFGAGSPTAIALGAGMELLSVGRR